MNWLSLWLIFIVKFGHEVNKIWLSKFGMNEKGSTEKAESKKYAFGSIIPLWEK